MTGDGRLRSALGAAIAAKREAVARAGARGEPAFFAAEIEAIIAEAAAAGPQDAPGALSGSGAGEASHVACDTAITGLRAEAEELRAKVAQYENAVTWETSCLSCGKVLDAAYAETVRKEKAEDTLREVRELAESWTADDGCGPPTPEMRLQADCGREMIAVLGGTAQNETGPERRPS